MTATAIKVQKISFPKFSLILTDPLSFYRLKKDYFALRIPEGYIPVRLVLAYNPNKYVSCLAFLSKTTQQTTLASNLSPEDLAKLSVPFGQGVWIHEVSLNESTLDLSLELPQEDLITKYMY